MFKNESLLECTDLSIKYSLLTRGLLILPLSYLAEIYLFQCRRVFCVYFQFT